MYIIIYSSIDHDNLNNLIVHAGEFLMWFNLNFEGESQAEIDFRESKCEIWKATCHLADLIIAAYKKMENNKKDLLTKFWWEHTRFEAFGTQVADTLTKKPQLKAQMRQLFSN